MDLEASDRVVALGSYPLEMVDRVDVAWETDKYIDVVGVDTCGVVNSFS